MEGGRERPKTLPNPATVGRRWTRAPDRPSHTVSLLNPQGPYILEPILPSRIDQAQAVSRRGLCALVPAGPPHPRHDHLSI